MEKSYEVFDNKVYPISNKGIIIPDNAVGFIILGRQLRFDNSNSVIEYYTGINIVLLRWII